MKRTRNKLLKFTIQIRLHLNWAKKSKCQRVCEMCSNSNSFAHRSNTTLCFELICESCQRQISYILLKNVFVDFTIVISVLLTVFVYYLLPITLSKLNQLNQQIFCVDGKLLCNNFQNRRTFTRIWVSVCSTDRLFCYIISNYRSRTMFFGCFYLLNFVIFFINFVVCFFLSKLSKRKTVFTT